MSGLGASNDECHGRLHFSAHTAALQRDHQAETNFNSITRWETSLTS